MLQKKPIVYGQYQVDRVNPFFDSIDKRNEEQLKLDYAPAEVFENSDQSRKSFRNATRKFTIRSLVEKNIKENYDLYRSIRTAFQANGTEVVETNVTGPLISKR